MIVHLDAQLQKKGRRLWIDSSELEINGLDKSLTSFPVSILESALSNYVGKAITTSLYEDMQRTVAARMNDLVRAGRVYAFQVSPESRMVGDVCEVKITIAFKPRDGDPVVWMSVNFRDG